MQVRPTIRPVDIVAMLAEVGAWGANLHDNDLVPVDATPSERDCVVREFSKACKENGLPRAYGHRLYVLSPCFPRWGAHGQLPAGARPCPAKIM
jgi:hypothetical protein